MIAHDAQHVGFVGAVTVECAEFLRHLGRGSVRYAGHDRGKRRSQCAAFIGIVSNAGSHEQAADIGVAKAECAEVVRKLRDFLGWELRHRD